MGYDKIVSFNSGLGFWPTSLFVELATDGNLSGSMEDLYNDICNQGCHDLIFFGDIKTYREELSWLLPRLVAELYIVSLILPMNKLIPLPARRIILTTDYEMFRKNHENVGSLGENDIILLQETDINKLKWLRKNLNKTFRGKIFFDEHYISRKDVLKSCIYDLFSIDLSW